MDKKHCQLIFPHIFCINICVCVRVCVWMEWLYSGGRVYSHFGDCITIPMLKKPICFTIYL